MNRKILYTIGDSFVFRGFDYKSWTSYLSDRLGWVDANNGMSGTSNDRSYRSVVRDISRIKKSGKLWTESTGDIECGLDDLFVIVGWTSPTRFEWFQNGAIGSVGICPVSVYIQNFGYFGNILRCYLHGSFTLYHL